jgi:hypothetical protein
VYDPTAELACVRMMQRVLSPVGDSMRLTAALDTFRDATRLKCDGQMEQAYQRFEQARREFRELIPWQEDLLARVVRHRSLASSEHERYAEGEAALEAALTRKAELDYEGAYRLLQEALLDYRRARDHDPVYRERALAARAGASTLVAVAHQEGERLLTEARAAEDGYWYDDADRLYRQATVAFERCVFDESLVEQTETRAARANRLDPRYLGCLKVLAQARGALRTDGPEAARLYRTVIRRLEGLARPDRVPREAVGAVIVGRSEDRHEASRARLEARRRKREVDDRRRVCAEWARARRILRGTADHYRRALTELETADRVWREAEGLFQQARRGDPGEELWAQAGSLFASARQHYDAAGASLSHVARDIGP